MRTIIFDLDGTLADTSGDLIAAANACFEARGEGAPLDPLLDQATGFAGGRAMLRLGAERRGLDAGAIAGRVEADFTRLLSFYDAAIDHHTTLYPDVVAVLDELAGAGWRLGVCTNKPEALAHKLLRRLGIAGHFSAMIGADTLPVRKPDPAPYRRAVADAGGSVAQSLLVGDTVTDRETARAAGVPCVLVGFGPEGAGIRRLEPEALLPHYRDLPEIARSLVG